MGPSETEDLEQEVLRELTRSVGVSREDATPREWLRATVECHREVTGSKVAALNGAAKK